jgi:hypothetical protein
MNRQERVLYEGLPAPSKAAGVPAALATAFAGRVVPVPGAPAGSTPCGADLHRLGKDTLKFHFKPER